MRVLHYKLDLETTKNQEVIDVTGKIEGWLREVKAKNGILIVYSPHTTTGIIINENEPGLKSDVLSFLSELTKPGASWKHNLVDANAHAHLANVIVGGERVIPVVNGRLALGTWQRVMFIEMDGPRFRSLFVTYIGECGD